MQLLGVIIITVAASLVTVCNAGAVSKDNGGFSLPICQGILGLCTGQELCNFLCGFNADSEYYYYGDPYSIGWPATHGCCNTAANDYTCKCCAVPDWITDKDKMCSCSEVYCDVVGIYITDETCDKKSGPGPHHRYRNSTTSIKPDNKAVQQFIQALASPH